MRYPIQKILWLSRHTMSSSQMADLKVAMQMSPPSQAFEYDFSMAEVVQINMTFPAHSREAVELIDSLTADQPKGWSKVVVCGVFPAHIAAALARRPHEIWHPAVWAPVSVPAFADDGSPRGFTHSHWEEV